MDQFTQSYLQMNKRAELVKWEPTKSEGYSVLFSRLLEIYSVSDNEPIHSITFDTNQKCFDYISETEIVVCDDKGRLTYLQNLHDAELISMRIIETKFKRFKQIVTAPDMSVFGTLTSDGFSIWNCD